MLFGFQLPSAAQEKPENQVPAFTLTEARAYAMEHAYSIKDAELDIKASKKDIWKTISTGLPQVKKSFTYQHNLEIGSNVIDFGGQKQEIKFGTPFNTTANITIDQKVFDGSYIIGLKASKIYLQLAKNVKTKTKIDIKENVANSYYLVLAAEENKRILEENLENARTNLMEVNEYYKNGFREALDVEQMELLVKQAENRLADAQRQVESSRAVLKFVMGMDVNKKIVLKDSLKQHINNALNKEHSLSVDPLAMKNHIDYRIGLDNLKAQDMLVKNEKAGFWPKISLFYNRSYTAMTDTGNIFASGTEWRKSSAIGLKISMPVIDFGGRSADLAKAKINRRKAQNQLEMTRQNLVKEFKVVSANFKSSLQTYTNSIQARDLANKIYCKTVIKFNNGLADSSVLNQNQNQFLQAHAESINATVNLLANCLEMKKISSQL